VGPAFPAALRRGLFIAMADTRLELRGMYPRDLMEALDMIALAKRTTRVDLVGRILTRYVVGVQHEASLVGKSPKVNPQHPDSDWSALG
jgi:hypothetical protein